MYACLILLMAAAAVVVAAPEAYAQGDPIATISGIENNADEGTTSITYMGADNMMVDIRLTDSDGNAIEESTGEVVANLLVRNLADATDYFIQIKLPSQEYGDNGTDNYRYTHPSSSSTLITHDPPRITTDLTGHVAPEGAVFELELEAQDADEGDTVTFSTVGNAGGATIMNNTLRWIPTTLQLGIHNITIRATDSDRQTDTQVMTVNVTENTALRLPDAVYPILNIYSTMRLDMTARNAEGDVRYSIDPLEGAFIHPDSGHLVYVPNGSQWGSQTITVYAEDDNHTAGTTVNILVIEPMANITSFARSGAEYLVTVSAGETGVSAQFINRSKGVTGYLGFPALSIPIPAGGSNNFNGPPFPADEHPVDDTLYYLWIRFSGNNTAEDNHIYAAFTPGESGYEIIPNPVSRPAHYVPDINATANASEPITVTPEPLLDNDGNNVTITGVTNGAQGTANHTDTTITYTPDASAAGNDTITYTVTDNAGTGVNGTITVAITGTTDANMPADGNMTDGNMTTDPPPSMPDVDDLSVSVHSTFRFDAAVANLSGSVQYSIDPPVRGVHINPDTGHLVWVPSADQTGLRNLTVRADSGADSVTRDITVNVTDPIAIIDSFTYSQGDTYILSYAAGSNNLDIFLRSRVNGITSDHHRGSIFADISGTTRAIGAYRSPHPNPDTLYYAEIRPESGDWESDENIFLQFMVRQSGFKVIPNPHTSPTDNPPVASSFVVALDALASNATDLLAQNLISDTDQHVSTLFVRLDDSQLPAWGEARLDGTVINYSARFDARETDTVYYIVTDGTGRETTGAITMDITNPNLPTARNASYGVDAGRSVLIDLLSDDLIDDGQDSPDSLAVTVSVQPEKGIATVLQNSSVLSYTAHGNASGTDTFVYTVIDSDNLNASGTVTIDIAESGEPNRGPEAPDILINAEIFFPSAVTPAVTHPDGDDITITRVTEPTLGILDTGMLPQISYTPSQTGIERLSYAAIDSKGGTDTGTITIFINPDGNARPALDHIYNVGGRVGVDLEFTATADDSDDTSLTFDIANAPDGASITPGGDFSWRPAESQNGTHLVTFIVHDDSGGADWQHVAVTILRENETNLPPVPQDIDAGVVLGGGRGFQPDIADPENDGTEITRVYDSSLGDVDRSFLSQGIIVYIAGVLGDDEVIYTVSDGRGGFANGTISITVEEPANVRPLIEFVGDKSVNAGNELTFTVDAKDLDGFVIDFGLEGATQGPSMSPFGVFSWTPTANDVGRHEFTILVFDDAGENSTVTIAVTVRPENHVNSPPVAPDVVIMTSQDVLSIVRPTLTDPDEGDPVRISQTGQTTKGSILSGFLRAGIIIYLPNQGETGTETITYTVSDSSDDTDTATINVFISARGNTDPILGSIDFRNINAGNPLAFDLEAEDPDGDAISYQPVGAPDGIEISPQGAFSWTPTAADVGNHTFTVIAYDDRGGADSKTAVIRVLPAGTANQVPNAPSSSVTVAPGGSVVITPAISDPDGDRVTIDDAVASGTGVVIPSEDSINYIHIATTPTETITYTVTDARGATSTGTITVTIR